MSRKPGVIAVLSLIVTALAVVPAFGSDHRRRLRLLVPEREHDGGPGIGPHLLEYRSHGYEPDGHDRPALLNQA